jgi:hypothetical protein
VACAETRSKHGVATDIKLFRDKIDADAWRVEYFDDDGGCYVAIFGGPAAERRARDYYEALMGGHPVR